MEILLNKTPKKILYSFILFQHNIYFSLIGGSNGEMKVLRYKE